MYFICGVGSKAVWLLGASALEDGGGPGGSEVRGGDGRGGRWGGVVMAGEKVGWGRGGGGGDGGQRGGRAEGLELGSGGRGGGVGGLAWVPSTCVETVSIPNVV